MRGGGGGGVSNKHCLLPFFIGFQFHSDLGLLVSYSLNMFFFSSPEPKDAHSPASSSSTMLKHLLLRNHSPNQSQILYGDSLGRGNESLFAASGSHDQDGRHDHIW